MCNNAFLSKEIINPKLLDKKKSVYILSISTNAKKIFSLLLQYRVFVSGFVAKDTAGTNKLYGLQVFGIESIKDKASIYVVDKMEWNLYERVVDEESVYFVEADKLACNKFVFQENGRIRECNAALTLTMMLSRVQKRRPVFLIKSGDYDFWINLVYVLKNDVKDPIIITVDSSIDQIYDLMYLNEEKIIVFIALFEYKEIENMLIELGFRQTRDFVHISNSFSGHVTDKYSGFDWLLGNTFVEKVGGKNYFGFHIHGNVENTSKKVVMLGNSTTDPFFYPQKSWPEMLLEKYKGKQRNVTIYNGAITDYSSTNEVIKLIRDVLTLQPDIVVSYSGVIDFREYLSGYPYVNLNIMRTCKEWESQSNKEVVYGLPDHRSAYERWISNEKIMHQICGMNGIYFMGVLQPWVGSDCIDACEQLKVWSDNYWQVVFPQFNQYISNAGEFKERIQEDVTKYEWLYDFTNIFAGIEDVDIYFDSIHVNEDGNKIVAEKFYEILELCI